MREGWDGRGEQEGREKEEERKWGKNNGRTDKEKREKEKRHRKVGDKVKQERKIWKGKKGVQRGRRESREQDTF